MTDIATYGPGRTVRNPAGPEVKRRPRAGVWAFLKWLTGLGEAPMELHGPWVPPGWGLAPALSLSTAFGLLLVALMQVPAIRGTGWGGLAYWCGLALILFPLAARIAWPATSRRELLTLVMLLGGAIYAVKILHAPTGFAQFDEFLHWRTASDIMRYGRLFAPNALLPISPHYPGLEIATTAVASLSGLSVFAAGVLLIAIARLILLGALFLLFETATASPRVAALGCTVFMANPSFGMFQAQFAYESLAFALMVLVMLGEPNLGAARRQSAAYLLFSAVLAAALGMTHHLTAYFVVAFMTFLALLELARPAPRDQIVKSAAVAAVAALATSLWPLFAGGSTLSYIAPAVERGLRQFFGFLEFHAPGRVPFVGDDGAALPLWNRLVALASLLLLCFGLATGFFRALALAGLRPATRADGRLSGRPTWNDSRLLALTLLTLAYPFCVLLKLTRGGWEIGDRLSAFVSIGNALVVAIAIFAFWQGYSPSRRRAGVTGLALGLMLLGGNILAWGPNAVVSRYKVAADAQSIEPAGIAAAVWTRRWLGEGNRFATDRINRLLLATYGRQVPVTTIADEIDTSYLLFAPRVAADQIDTIRRAGVDYLLVDLRLTEGKPALGVYFEGGEDRAIHAAPPEKDALLKYNGLGTVGRPFDNGLSVIYDVRALRERH